MPILEGFIFTFFIVSEEFLFKVVKTIKKAADEISPGILYEKLLKFFLPSTFIKSNFSFFLTFIGTLIAFLKKVLYDLVI